MNYLTLVGAGITGIISITTTLITVSIFFYKNTKRAEKRLATMEQKIIELAGNNKNYTEDLCLLETEIGSMKQGRVSCRNDIYTLQMESQKNKENQDKLEKKISDNHITILLKFDKIDEHFNSFYSSINEIKQNIVSLGFITDQIKDHEQRIREQEKRVSS